MYCDGYILLPVATHGHELSYFINSWMHAPKMNILLDFLKLKVLLMNSV